MKVNPELKSVSLSSLWGMAEESLRALIDARYRRHHLPEHDGLAAGDDGPWAPSRTVLRSIDIDCTPEALWPWVAQIMRGGGVYGWPLLESGGVTSADHLLNQPPPSPGERAMDCLELERVKAGREITWRARCFSVMGHRLQELLIGYEITELPARRSRLTARVAWRDSSLTMQVGDHLLGVLDFVLLKHQLLRVKSLAERKSHGGHTKHA